jgi:glycosyltransferase involved in cell wall biosynthesis
MRTVRIEEWIGRRQSGITEAATMTAGRRVLMLVSGFPPARQAVLRTVKFAKYLPDYGWKPIVVTPFAMVGPRGKALVQAPDGVLVKRTPRIPTPSLLATSMVYRRDDESFIRTPRQVEVGRIRSSLETAVRKALLWSDMPDAFAGWIPFAVMTGWRLARSYRVSAIQASGPPFSVVCAGAILSRLTGLPLVADFRDPWTLDISDPIGALTGPFVVQSSARRLKVVRSFERWVLGRSSAVVFTSGATRALYVDKYPEIEGKSYLIYNGADPEDFLGEVRAPERPTVAHVGTLHDFQADQVEFFLRGFGTALRTRAIPPDTEVVLAGAIGLRLRSRLERVLKDVGIVTSVRLAGFLPHQEAIQVMRGSRLLLLFAGEGRHYFRLSKISEYLAAGSAILAFAPDESDTAEEVRLYRGRVLSEPSEEKLEAELILALSGHSRNYREPREIGHPHPLNRRTGAQSLGEILDCVAAVR